MNEPPVDIRIAGYLAASHLLERERNEWDALVLIDSNKQPSEFVREHARSHLILHFDDVEEPRLHLRPPTTRQIAEALEFARGKGRLLVSCRAGQGRSAALAYLVACARHGPAAALALLNPTRHRPNRLVVSLGDPLLDTPGALSAFDEWRHLHSHVRLSDYADEIEREFEALEAQGATNRICPP